MYASDLSTFFPLNESVVILVGEDFKHRFGYNAEPEQIIAGTAFILCALGAPCIYYGTEQGLVGCDYDW